jgi:hypothetical protein
MRTPIFTLLNLFFLLSAMPITDLGAQETHVLTGMVINQENQEKLPGAVVLYQRHLVRHFNQ